MGSDATVFVIENNVAGGEAAEHLLKANGFIVRGHGSCHAFLDSPHSHQAGCILVDGRMPDMSGLELITYLQADSRWKPVIVLAAQSDIETAVSAMKIGAHDVIGRPFKLPALLTKVRHALDHDIDYRESKRAARKINACMSRLTQREREVMELMVAGLSNKLIGQRLGIGHRTVEVHRAHLLEKMRARSSADLIRMALTVKRPPASPLQWFTEGFPLHEQLA